MQWIAVNSLPLASNYDEVVGLCGKVHMRSKPGANLSLKFLQFANIMKQRPSKNQVMITWIEACSQLGNCGNVYGMFEQAANNGSMVSHRCGPS